eukprot:scaffold269378_cov30-Tisochrysis_lutea.AAC.2
MPLARFLRRFRAFRPRAAFCMFTTALPYRISFARRTHEWPIEAAMAAALRIMRSARRRRILASRKIVQRTAAMARRKRQRASTRAMRLKNLSSSFRDPSMSESTKASFVDLKKALVSPSKKSVRPSSREVRRVVANCAAGRFWNFAGHIGLNDSSRVLKGMRTE